MVKKKKKKEREREKGKRPEVQLTDYSLATYMDLHSFFFNLEEKLLQKVSLGHQFLLQADEQVVLPDMNRLFPGCAFMINESQTKTRKLIH